MRALSVVVALVALVAAQACSGGAEHGRPAASAIKFSKLVRSLAKRGFAPVVEAGFDGRSWNVVALRDGTPVQLTVNPTVGHLGKVRALADTKHEVPPADGRPLWQIAEQLEQAGYTPILEVEFEDGKWEIEALAPVELDVDPGTGEVLQSELDVDD